MSLCHIPSTPGWPYERANIWPYNMTGGLGGNVSFQNPIGLHTGMAIPVCKGYVGLSYHLHFRISSVMSFWFWVKAKDSDLSDLQVVALAMAGGEGGLATRPVAGSREFSHMLSYQMPICCTLVPASGRTNDMTQRHMVCTQESWLSNPWERKEWPP